MRKLQQNASLCPHIHKILFYRGLSLRQWSWHVKSIYRRLGIAHGCDGWTLCENTHLPWVLYLKINEIRWDSVRYGWKSKLATSFIGSDEGIWPKIACTPTGSPTQARESTHKRSGNDQSGSERIDYLNDCSFMGRCFIKRGRWTLGKLRSSQEVFQDHAGRRDQRTSRQGSQQPIIFSTLELGCEPTMNDSGPNALAITLPSRFSTVLNFTTWRFCTYPLMICTATGRMRIPTCSERRMTFMQAA